MSNRAIKIQSPEPSTDQPSNLTAQPFAVEAGAPVATLQKPSPIARLKRSTKAPIVVFIVLCAIWGSTWIFIKTGLRDLPPLTFAGVRFAIAVLILSPVIVARRSKLPVGLREWGLLAVTGILGFTLNYGLLFWGEQHTSSGLAALLQATIPVFGMLIANYYLPAERLTKRKLIGAALGFAGVALIFSNQISAVGPLAFQGSVAIVVGALCVSYSNVLVKAKARHFDPGVLAAGQMFFGLIPLLAIGLAREGNPLNFHWTAMAFVSLLYLALIGSALAFFLFYWLVKHMDVTRTMLIALVTPLIAVLIGIIAVGESLTWRIALGGLGILAGIKLINSSPRRIVREIKTG